ncbi:MAG: hypothetical protein ACO1N7_02880, partial [Sphingobacteriaceae bacterium]
EAINDSKVSAVEELLSDGTTEDFSHLFDSLIDLILRSFSGISFLEVLQASFLVSNFKIIQGFPLPA